MKKLVAISAMALALAACSSDNGHPPHGDRPQNPELDAAMKACHETSGQDQTQFEACMKEKGVEKPANQPSQMPPMPQSN